MTATGIPRFTAEWLDLREHADAAARAPELVGPLRAHLADVPWPGQLVIRDLGSGTGAMPRWLAGLLPGPQHWILHDQDPGLLDHAAARLRDAGGELMTVATEQGDVTGLTAGDLAGTSLVTASALLDLLTEDEVEALAAACVEAGCPALLTLTVVGRVELAPADPLDAGLAAAFNAHQRRTAGGRRLLGPAAVAATTGAFARRGAAVRSHASPWRLGPDQAALAAEWLRGWVAAACEQRPELVGESEAYLVQRLAACAAGQLRVVVHHRDVLAFPPGRPDGPA